MTLLETKESGNKGTYVGARFAPETVEKLKTLVKALKIPNPLDPAEYHTTIIYSRTPFKEGFKPLGEISPPWKGKPEKFHVFKTQTQQKNALVIIYTCKEQTARHEQLMKDYDATYDFPEYILHTTVSYDIGDFEWEDLKFEEYLDEILIAKEYEEELNFDKYNKDDDDE